VAYEDAEKRPDPVILSEAKDLDWFVFKQTLQMLRCAQHDRRPFSASCYLPRTFLNLASNEILLSFQ
jgi:hypothetical protein